MPFRHLGSEGNPEKASSRDEAIGGESHQGGERGGDGEKARARGLASGARSFMVASQGCHRCWVLQAVR